MQFQLFQYPFPVPAGPDGTSGLADLNAFLATHRVASVTHHIVQAGGATLLVVLVQTISGPAPATKAARTGETRVDYKAILSAEQFACFSRLREGRRSWAEAEGVPVYAVFTNAQLAEMVKRAPRSLEDLNGIEGLGPARVEKYGVRLLALMEDLARGSAVAKPETGDGAIP